MDNYRPFKVMHDRSVKRQMQLLAEIIHAKKQKVTKTDLSKINNEPTEEGAYQDEALQNSQMSVPGQEQANNRKGSFNSKGQNEMETLQLKKPVKENSQQITLLGPLIDPLIRRKEKMNEASQILKQLMIDNVRSREQLNFYKFQSKIEQTATAKPILQRNNESSLQRKRIT